MASSPQTTCTSVVTTAHSKQGGTPRRAIESLPEVILGISIYGYTFNFVYIIFIGEDETSFNRHVKVLKNEKVKSHPNMQVVEDLMEKTFFMRRSDITNNARDILAILNEYPFLSVEDQVS